MQEVSTVGVAGEVIFEVMNTAYLLLGGNLGDREKQLAQARGLLQEYCGEITRASSLYETAAWGNKDQPSFLNQALALKTEMNARQLIRRILKIERSMGRIRKEKWEPRPIDIDILLFNNEKHDTAFLKVPHPELPNRMFALLPLEEIAPDLVHPLLKRSVHELREICTDVLPVTRYS